MRVPLRTRSGSEAAADAEAEADAERRSENVSRLHGLLRGYLRNRPERGQGLQRHLNQARMGVRYDRYLARALTTATSVGVLAGAAVFGAVLLFGVGGAAARLGLGALAALVVAAGTVAAGWGLALYVPRSRAETRARRIDLLLPQAISYLYALSASGNDVTRIVRSFADEEASYGEVSREFDHVVREMDYFGNDPLTALQNLRDLTPSDNLQSFVDDLVNTLESGGDVGEFFRAESDKYFDRARDRQEAFIEGLSTLAEVYIGAAVVGPLFFVVVLLVVSLVGGEVLGAIYGTVYVLIPALLGVVLLLVYRLSRGYGDVKVEPRGPAVDPMAAADLDDDRLDRYRSRRRIVAVRDLLARPGAFVQQRPVRVLALSVPAAALLAAGVVLSGFVRPTTAAVAAEPVRATTALFVAPALVAFGPLSVLHERRRRRQNRIVDRFPDFLNQLSTANEMGLNVTEALDLVARRSQGDLAEEVRMAANDSYWTGDFGASLGRLADRLGSAQATRTLTLVGTASRVSGDIHRVLDIAARDAADAARLRRSRLGEMRAYTLVVVVAFAIYLAIVLVLDVTFLSVFDDIAGRLPADVEGPVQVSRVDVSVYRMLLFHSALLQAAGTGLVAGKMGEDSLLSGLKYSIGLTLLTVGAYVAVVGV